MLSPRRYDLSEAEAVYFEHVAATCCPFLAPAHQSGLVSFFRCSLNAGTVEAAQEALTLALVVHTEHFRERRRRATGRTAALLCDNVVVLLPNLRRNQHKAVLELPHWYCKVMYTSDAILFGKFWTGERDIAKDGSPLPIPPLTFVSLRSAVRTLDGRFFHRAGELRPDFDTAAPSEQSPLMTHAELRSIHETVARSIESTAKADPLDIAEELAETGAYEAMRIARHNKEESLAKIA